jgi:hypothetical protein
MKKERKSKERDKINRKREGGVWLNSELLFKYDPVLT